MIRTEFLQYVWDKCIEPQMGYSFSVPHDVAYSVIGLQEMNLSYCYDSLYWACACLCVNAGSNDVDFEDEEVMELGDEEDTSPWENVEKTEEEIDSATIIGKTKTIAPNYGKISRALSNMQKAGINIEAPDINKAQLDFIPDIATKSILYSLSAVTNINSNIAIQIIQNRPYDSFEDFLQKNTLTNLQIISLIKSGSFDNLEPLSRVRLMRKYFDLFAASKVNKKDKLTLTHLKKAVELNILPSQYKNIGRIMGFKKWIDDNEFDSVSKTYTIIDDDSKRFFTLAFLQSANLITDKDYTIVSGGYLIKNTVLSKSYKALIQPALDWLNSTEGLEAFYQTECSIIVQEQLDKYAIGSLGDWEMGALGFYSKKHELASVCRERYKIIPFDQLCENPSPKAIKTLKNGKTVPIYEITAQMGTVIASNNNKHTVTILTPDGVVDLKFYAGSYIYYNKNISQIDEKGVKHTIDKSWFTRGNKILVYGIRNENMFIPKTDYNIGIRHSVALITNVSTTGDLSLVTTREINE